MNSARLAILWVVLISTFFIFEVNPKLALRYPYEL